MNTKSSSILTKRYNLTLSTIHSVYRLINSTFSPKELLVGISRIIASSLNTAEVILILAEPSKSYMIYKLKSDKEGKKTYSVKRIFKLNEMERKLIHRGQYIKQRKILAAPLVEEDILGAVIVKRGSQQNEFDNFDQRTLLILTEQIVMAFHNIRLNDEHQKLILGTVKSLVKLLDSKIPFLYRHSQNFMRLVLAIGKEMDLRVNDLKSLEYASLLYDAGKMDIPLDILTKSTKLTGKEVDIIRGHPTKGVELVRHLEVLKPVIPIIMHHHERYDGKGYPSGLKKNKIPLGARIMAVADAFEAMVFGRPYRQRMNVDKAIEEIKKKSNTQFDPKIVDSFIKAVTKGRLRRIIKFYRQK